MIIYNSKSFIQIPYNKCKKYKKLTQMINGSNMSKQIKIQESIASISSKCHNEPNSKICDKFGLYLNNIEDTLKKYENIENTEKKFF